VQMPLEDVRVTRTKHVVWSNQEFTQPNARLILLTALLENIWDYLRRILFLPVAEYVGTTSLIRLSQLSEYLNTWLFTKLWYFNVYTSVFTVQTGIIWYFTFWNFHNKKMQ